MNRIAVKSYSYRCTRKGVDSVRLDETLWLDPADTVVVTKLPESCNAPVRALGDILVYGTVRGYERGGRPAESVLAGRYVYFGIVDFEPPARERYLVRLGTSGTGSAMYPGRYVLELDGKEYGRADMEGNLARVRAELDRIRTEEALDAIGG